MHFNALNIPMGKVRSGLRKLYMLTAPKTHDKDAPTGFNR